MSGHAPKDRVRIEFDAAFFAPEAIQKAALKFTEAYSFEFLKGDGLIVALVSPLSETFAISPSFEASFRNEALDQHLRDMVRKETEAERNLILAYAFSNTKLVSS